MRFGICMSGNEEAFERYLNLPTAAPFTYVEIGAASGRTLRACIHIIKGKRARWKAVAVDLVNGWSLNRKAILNNTKDDLDKFHIAPETLPEMPWNKCSVILQGNGKTFWDLWKGDIDFLFIDGCHGYNCANNDFVRGSSFVRKGGIVAFHDANAGCQGGDIQPHCGTGIDVRRALQDLGLLTNKCTGWKFLEETNGKNAMAFFQRIDN